MAKQNYLCGKRIEPQGITQHISVSQLIDETFLAYNAARLRQACHLFTKKILEPNVIVGISLSGALTPAGLQLSCLVPLMEAGFIDWIVSTGAILYHDANHALGFDFKQGHYNLDDVKLREEGVIRIYDVLTDYETLLNTDQYFCRIFEEPEFRERLSTADFHYLIGKHLRKETQKNGRRSLLVTAYECGIPVYTSSPGDSSIGMNAALSLFNGHDFFLDALRDVNETAALVYEAKRKGASAAVIFGGGSPKNFILQTEPQLQEVLQVGTKGHDYFLQFTDARADTGGLSGATPQEAVSWGKIEPGKVEETVVCYVDTTLAMPLLSAYALSNHEPRPLHRLYSRKNELLQTLKTDYLNRKEKEGQ